MRSKFQKIVLLVACLTCVLFSFSFTPVNALTDADKQKIADLQKQIEDLEHQAEQLRGSIADKAEEAQSIQKQVASLTSQIKAIQFEIQSTGVKINKTGLEIEDVKVDISDAQQKINYQKLTIAQLILDVDKRDSEDLISILIKNRDLSDFVRQTQYNETVNSTLLGIVSDLKKTKQDLAGQQVDLEHRKSSLESLKQQQSSQQSVLANAQSQQKNLLASTKGQQAAYQKQLVEVEQKKSTFFNQLRELETQIIQGGYYIVRITATSVPAKGTKLFQNPEASFKVTQGYGCTSYARCGKSSGPYGGAPHNGVDLAHGYGTPIMAIGEGEIIANGKNDGWGNWVAIKHPNQYNLVSVYGHMSSLSFLPVGSKVKAGAVIGYEGNTGNATGSHLHLSLYKDFFTYVNEKKDQLYFNYFEGSLNPLDYI